MVASIRTFAIVVLLLTFATSCSPNADEKNDQSAETLEEVRVSAESYRNSLSEQLLAATWPEAYTPVSDKVFERTILPNSVFPDPGHYATMIVGLFQECAWNMEWLDAHAAADSDAEDAAMEMLTTTISNQGSDPESQEFTRKAAQSALLGDVAPMQQFVEQNCMPLNWLMET